MPTFTIEYRDERHRIALKQAIAYVTELHQIAQDAPRGSVLGPCKKLALSDGRAEFVRESDASSRIQNPIILNSDPVGFTSIRKLEFVILNRFLHSRSE
jgi:hypothetical protein